LRNGRGEGGGWRGRKGGLDHLTADFFDLGQINAGVDLTRLKVLVLDIVIFRMRNEVDRVGKYPPSLFVKFIF